MQYPLKIKELCTPARIYLYLSLIGLLASIMQNVMEFNSGVYKCGMFSVLVPSVFMIFLFKLIYITFWAYVLNLLCKDKNRMLAWTLVLFPFLLLFVILGLFLITGKKAEKQLNIQDSSEGFGVVDMQKGGMDLPLDGAKPIGVARPQPST